MTNTSRMEQWVQIWDFWCTKVPECQGGELAKRIRVTCVQVSVKLSDGSVMVYDAFHPINVEDLVKNNQYWEICIDVCEQIVIHQAVTLGKWLSGENFSLFQHCNDSLNTLQDKNKDLVQMGHLQYYIS